jgi:alpha-tubulin suppressor-like RCC1 family protein
VALGGEHACAIFFDGSVRCWGEARAGALGRGDLVDTGDGIGPSVHAAGPLDLVRPAEWLAVGGASTCVGSAGALRCWGYNETGMLGYGDTAPRGSTPATVPALLSDLPVGVGVRAVGLGFERACAITIGGGVRCWGLSPLGYAGVAAVGTGPDVPSIADVGDVELVTDGETFEAVKVVAGMHHACALSKVGRIKCWGEWKFLGLDVPTNVGDDEAPSAVGFVNQTWTATDLSSFSEHTCAVTVGADVYCWGEDHWGVLGSDVPGSSVALTPINVEIGSAYTRAEAVAAGGDFTCILTTEGRVRCWGDNDHGQLGRGNNAVWGDDPGETPGANPFVDLGAMPIVQVAAGTSSACAVARDGAVRCWGSNLDAQLGIDSFEHIGDEPNELPPKPIVF